MTFAPGTLVAGRFRIERALGAGGMGEVYVARQLELGRDVALKTMRADRAGDAAAIERFRREAGALAKVAHPHVVTIYDFGIDDATLYLAMELVRGEDLRVRLRRGALTIADAVAIARDVADALAAVHGAGVLHRDVKPENVLLVDGAARAPFAKLLDFGVARAEVTGTASGPTADATLTGAGLVVGTVGYIAPDVAMGGAVDVRADLYALGVVLYEMLTGGAPFRESTPAAVVVRQVGTDAPRVREKRPDASAELDALVATLLARDPAERPASAADVSARLASAGVAIPSAPLSSAPPPSAPPPSAPPPSAPLSRSSPRRAIAFGALALAAALVIAGFAVARWRTAHATDLDARCAHSDNPAVQQHVTAALAAARTDPPEERRAWLAALDVDPDFAPAHVMLAATAGPYRANLALEHYRAATKHTARLCARDRALLRATEPMVREKVDTTAAAALFDEAHAAFPNDRLTTLLAARTADVAKNRPRALALLAEAQARDPNDVVAIQEEAAVRSAMDDDNAALAALDRCIRTAPTNVRCRSLQTLWLSNLGHCEDALAAAAELARFGDDASWLAELRASQGEPLDAVLALLPAHRDVGDDDVRLRAWAGDFAGALAAIDAGRTQKDPSRLPRLDLASTAQLQVDLLREMGREEEALAVSADILANAQQLVGASDSGWRLPLEADLVAAGKMERAVHDLHLEAWRKKAAELEDRVLIPNEIWTAGWAHPARTVEEAKAALAVFAAKKLPEPEELRSLRMLVELARVRRLAGENALPILERIAKSCDPVTTPVGAMRARLWLGEERERAGNVEGARAAYRFVIARWGATSSVTAKQAQARLAALAAPAGK